MFVIPAKAGMTTSYEAIINNCIFKTVKHSHSGLQKMEPE